MKLRFLLSVLLAFFLVEGKAQNVNPFKKVNSSYDEQNPILSPDQQILYFTRANDPANFGNERDPGDIWYSVIGPQGWSEPMRASNINSYSWNGVLGFDQNGAEIILHNHYATGSFLKTQGISTAKRQNDGWSQPENINIPYFKNHSQNFGGSLSSSNNVAVFSLETFNTKGAEDIYVSFKRDGKWTEPKNLGSVINTEFQEFTPFIYKDSLLYFASNGHKGKGSTDIFVSKRLDDTWLNWSKPENLKKVNTEGRELGYRQYEDFAIYTSTINSDGYGDIKLYVEGEEQVFKQKEEADTVSIKEIAKQEIKDNEIVLYGSISGDGKEIKKAWVDVTSSSGKPRVTIDDSMYLVNLKSPESYLVTVSAPGFISEQESVELISGEAKKLQIDFNLKPIAVGTRVNLKNVLFKQSKAEIIESSFSQLNLVADLMKQNPSMKIRLEGHTDNRGVAKHNVRLSKMRVDAVEDYLVSKGISSRRIKGKGYGGSKPIADNEDPDKRKLNRRVEFTIIKD